jgi:hypothetical protein
MPLVDPVTKAALPFKLMARVLPLLAAQQAWQTSAAPHKSSLCGGSFRIVIPAKAGIQPGATSLRMDWIPAFAGMTVQIAAQPVTPSNYCGQ